MLRLPLVTVCLALLACGDDENAGDTTDAAGEADAPGADASDDVAADSAIADSALADTAAPDTSAPDTTADVPAEIDDSPLGGDRPAKLVLPAGFDPDVARPLLILLHGYSATGEIQDAYLGVSRNAALKGFITVVPDGTKDATGLQFWNADPGFCCNFGNSPVDDVGFILGLVAEAQARFTIDPKRIYLMGHSNGGFMSYKMACTHADVFASVAVFAGSLPLERDDCDPSEPVSVLHMHGTVDATIPYAGSNQQYPGAEDTAARWAEYNGCEILPTVIGKRDYDNQALGDETELRDYPRCAEGCATELWKMEGTGHVPLGLSAEFMPAVLDWLASHPKP